MPLDQLPGPVRNALAKRFPVVRWIEATREERNDYVYFFVKVRRESGSAIDRVTITENGDITKVNVGVPR